MVTSISQRSGGKFNWMNFDWKLHYKSVRIRKILEWFFTFHPEFVFLPAFHENALMCLYVFWFQSFWVAEKFILFNGFGWFKFTAIINVNLVIDTHRLPIRFDNLLWALYAAPSVVSVSDFRVKLIRLYCLKIKFINPPTLKTKKNNFHCDGRDRGKSQRKQDEKRSGVRERRRRQLSVMTASAVLMKFWTRKILKMHGRPSVCYAYIAFILFLQSLRTKYIETQQSTTVLNQT